MPMVPLSVKALSMPSPHTTVTQKWLQGCRRWDRLSLRFGGCSSAVSGPSGYASMSLISLGKGQSKPGSGVSENPDPGFAERTCDNRRGSKVAHLLWH